ncbi:accA1, partial [Symbiodinium sp. KB8]
GAGLDDAALADAAREVGFPVLLKPSAGGGGKGMRLVDDEGGLADAIASARREATNSFGDDTLLVERFVTNPRHIEIQVVADTHGNVAVFGVDLVEWQVRIAAGEPIPKAQDELTFDGHAVEVRVYAEDPARGFLPTGGEIVGYREPDLDGVRVDSGVAAGTVVGSNFDPMLAKVIAWGADRAEALQTLDRALADTVLAGVTTNVGFLRRLLSLDDVRAGRLDTGLVERHLDDVAERS